MNYFIQDIMYITGATYRVAKEVYYNLDPDFDPYHSMDYEAEVERVAELMRENLTNERWIA